jgi:hypothetical protein
MNKTELSKRASYLTASFATLAFAQSGHTMASIAMTHGGYDPVVAWITPVLIDGALVQLGLTKVALGSKAPKWLTVTIWGSIALSMGLNCLGHGWLGLIAPAMLAVSFESWVRLMESPAQTGARTKRAARKPAKK